MGREVLVDFRTAEVQTKLLFKYSEFVAEYGGVGIPEFWKAVAKLCKSPVKHTSVYNKEITGPRCLCPVPVEYSVVKL
jgi:hypothetical protein